MTDDRLNPSYNDLIGDIMRKHTEEGGMDNLKGQGKPISQEYFSGDTFQHFQRIAKDAGYKPHWLKLQHEISIELQGIAKLVQADPACDMTTRIDKVNEKIAEHNKSCPAPMLKGSVTFTNLEASLERWK